MEKNLYRKSLLFLEKEKLYILSKELKNLWLISNYYMGAIEKNDTKSNNGEKIDLENNFCILKKEIENLNKSIINHKNNLNKIIKKVSDTNNDNNDNNTNKNTYNINLLIYIDNFRKYTKSLILKLDLISTKISQMLRDGYHQYIPRPIIGKRHSNINITSEVERTLTNRLKKLNDSNITPLIVWDYKDDYKVKKSNDNIYFNLSYWYFDFPYLLPNLTHEIGHYIINSNRNKNIQDIIYKQIKKTFTIQELYHLDSQRLPEQLSKEMVADVIAYLHHGNSYLFALSHKLIGLDLSLTFATKDMKLTFDLLDISNLDIDNSYYIAPYKFNFKRDTVFIRLYVLVKLRNIIEEVYDSKYKEKFIYCKDKVDEIEDLLKSMYSFDNTNIENSLSEIYDNYSNYQEDYLNTRKVVKKVSEQILLVFQNNISYLSDIFKDKKKSSNENNMYQNILSIFLKKDKEETISENICENTIEQPKHFNHFWQNRFKNLEEEKISHRMIYRKKLHASLIEKLMKEGLLDKTNLKPYSMVFTKFRLDHIDSYNKIPKITFQNLENKNDESVSLQGGVLGIYDYVYIRELDENFKIEHFDIKDKCLEKYKYYETSFSLMKIMNDIENDCKQQINNLFSSIIQIEIEKQHYNKDNKSIYLNIFNDLDTIYKIIKDVIKDKVYRKISFYKSLGPKDITICIENADLDIIFNIKEKLYKKFNRTYTTIFLNRLDSNEVYEHKIQLEGKYCFVTDLRMHPNYGKEENKIIFKSCCENIKTNIKQVSLKTGVMDYVIVWNNNTELNTLIKFYEKLLEEKLVYDIQTSIEKKLDLNSDF